MYQYQQKSVLILSAIAIILIGGCGSSEESDKPSGNSTESSTSTMQDNIENQKKLEEDATSSLGNVSIEENFEFSTQKTISIDIRFTNTAYDEKIAIYTKLDPSSNTPVDLLEQGTINQSSNYKTVVSVASVLNSLVIVRNDNFSALVEVTINNYGQIKHTFEE